MPANKSHHYVPQMYMRLFARTGESRVGIYVIDRAQFIPNAPIRGQACRNYFYGKDSGIERAFGYLEGKASRIFSDAIHYERLPASASEDYEWLILYLCLQHCRTLSAAEQHNARMEEAAKAVLAHKAELEGNSELLAALNRVRIRPVDSVSDLIDYGAKAAELLSDLKFAIIKNSSKTPFIASDAPVVLHNRIYENQTISVTGYANVGLQLFLPLGPEIAIFGFDGEAYSVQTDMGGLVRISDDEQVSLINDLQWEAAQTVLILPPGMPKQVLKASAQDWTSRHSKVRVLLREEIAHQSDGKVRTRYGSGWRPSTVSLDLAFITSNLPKPALLAPWEVPPFRDYDRVARFDQERGRRK